MLTQWLSVAYRTPVMRTTSPAVNARCCLDIHSNLSQLYLNLQPRRIDGARKRRERCHSLAEVGAQFLHEGRPRPSNGECARSSPNAGSSLRRCGRGRRRDPAEPVSRTHERVVDRRGARRPCRTEGAACTVARARGPRTAEGASRAAGRTGSTASTRRPPWPEQRRMRALIDECVKLVKARRARAAA
jgi:hypothetical protein